MRSTDVNRDQEHVQWEGEICVSPWCSSVEEELKKTEFSVFYRTSSLLALTRGLSCGHDAPELATEFKKESISSRRGAEG